MTSTPAPSTDPDADIAALRDVVRRVEDGFNHNDAALMTSDMAEDAVAIDAMGRLMRGREEIVAVSEAGLAGPYLRDATAYYRLGDITSLAPGVYAATKEAWSTEAQATAGEPPEMRALYVFVRRDGRWLIARRANTLVRS